MGTERPLVKPKARRRSAFKATPQARVQCSPLGIGLSMATVEAIGWMPCAMLVPDRLLETLIDKRHTKMLRDTVDFITSRGEHVSRETLFYAIRSDYIEGFKALVSARDARLDRDLTRDSRADDGLYTIAAILNRVEHLRVLRELRVPGMNDGWFDALNEALYRGHDECAKCLIPAKRPEDKGEQYYLCKTLALAVERNSVESIRLLTPLCDQDVVKTVQSAGTDAVTA